MRSGVALSTLRTEVKIESHVSTASAHGDQINERIKQLLNRMERQLALRVSWLPMKTEQEVTVLANQGTSALPTALPSNINFTNIDQVWCAYGGDWTLVTYGIGREERSAIGPAERSSPIMKWEVIYPGTTSFETWPTSPQNETLRFTGSRTVGAMVNDGDTCLLDGDVLVLMAAGEMLATKDPELAKLKLAQANTMIQSLQYHQQGKKAEPIDLLGHRPIIGRPGLDFMPPIG